VLSTPGAAVVPGWSDAVVMQMVRRAFFTAIKLTVINRTKIGIFDPDAGGLMEANEASTSSVTAMMSPSAFGLDPMRVVSMRRSVTGLIATRRGGAEASMARLAPVSG
jgi:hypothetical protein